MFLIICGVTVDCLFAETKFKEINRLEAMEKQVQPPRPDETTVAEYNTEDLRDPFEIYVEEKKDGGTSEPEKEEAIPSDPPALTIQGIIWGGKIPQAIIDGKVVKIDDVIGEAKIIAIDKNGVTVEYKNYKYTLTTVPAAGKTQK